MWPSGPTFPGPAATPAQPVSSWEMEVVQAEPGRGGNGCFLGDRLFHSRPTFLLEFMTSCSSPSLEASRPTPAGPWARWLPVLRQDLC